MRAGDASATVRQWRLELLNMRWRAFIEGWGWE